MTLGADQEQLGHELRIGQMQTNIEKMRFDLAMGSRKLNRQTWGIVFSGIGLVVGAFAAGAAWVHYFHP